MRLNNAQTVKNMRWLRRRVAALNSLATRINKKEEDEHGDV